MIEVKFYYQRTNGHWYTGFKTFHDVHKAIRFIYKCNISPKMVYSGEVECDDPYDQDLISRRFQ